MNLKNKTALIKTLDSQKMKKTAFVHKYTIYTIDTAMAIMHTFNVLYKRRLYLVAGRTSTYFVFPPLPKSCATMDHFPYW